MAEFVGVPYIEVVKAAVIPALLYYIGVWIGVHYEAKKFGLKGTRVINYLSLVNCLWKKAI